jgi:high-affinity K+ transport system ATPase subunit B
VEDTQNPAILQASHLSFGKEFVYSAQNHDQSFTHFRGRFGCNLVQKSFAGAIFFWRFFAVIFAVYAISFAEPSTVSASL